MEAPDAVRSTGTWTARSPTRTVIVAGAESCRASSSPARINAAPGCAGSSATRDGARHLALGVALLRGVALVVQLLSLPQRHHHLRTSLLEVEVERDQRQPLPLHRPDEAADLAPVQQQLARALRLVVELVPLVVRRDVQVQQVHLAVLDDAVGIGQRRLAVAQRLDLGARE